MVKIISLNVRGLADERKRRSIFDYCRKRSDFAVLQETHSVREIESIWKTEWGSNIVFSHGKSDARGICILLPCNFDYKMFNIETDEEGRYIVLDIKIEECILTLVGLYAPNKDSPCFFQDIHKILANGNECKIVIGDFNLTLNNIDRLNCISNNNKSAQIVQQMCNEYLLEDVWRVRNPNEKQFTWFKNHTDKYEVKASRIDYVLVSRGMLVENATFCPAMFTDHRAVFVSISTQQNKRGPGYWKINNLLLQNEDYVQFMTNTLKKKIEQTQLLDPLLRWEQIKKEIATKTKNYSRKERGIKTLTISQLLENIDILQSNIPLNQSKLHILEKSIADLEKLQDEYVQGVMFRSKAKWYNEGEQSSKYFLNLEKSRYNARTCRVLLDSGKEIHNQDVILAKQREFYVDLYASDPSIDFSLTNDQNIYIPEHMQQSFEYEFNIEELKLAIMSMKKNKMPGKDGISVDFYQRFWEIIKGPMFEMVTESFYKSKIPLSMSEGILNLIPKGNKDARLLKNLRPITLLNSDYKAVEKMISNRLREALPYIIHPDQTGFMLNRRISTNIRKILDLVMITKRNKQEALLLCCDFLKCFDRVEFTCITESLKYFKFGNYLTNWVSILYKNFNIQVQNNGFFSEKIDVTRSIHQGGCCSAELFLLCAEILAIKIRNEGIKGIKYGDLEQLLNQFADDTDVASPFEEDNLNKIIQIFDEFQRNSGFTLNYDKTTIYRLGSLRNTNAKLYTQKPLNWSNEPFNVLGVWISDNVDELITMNYDPIITKVQEVLGMWSNRSLSLMGKITVINSLVASLFVYKIMVLPFIPTSYVKKFENIVTTFLWNGKKPKIPLRILQLSKKSGGMNLINLRSREISLKCTWIQIIESDARTMELASYVLNTKINGDIWKCNLNKRDVREAFEPSFWRDVLEAWSYVNFSTSWEDKPLWYNSNIRINNKVIFWEEAYNKGLLWISQISSNGKMISLEEAKLLFNLNYFEIYQLWQALPTQYKGNAIPNSSQYDLNVTHKNLSRLVYGNLTNLRDQNIAQKVNKWANDWASEFSYEDYVSACREIFIVSNVPKLRSFQYRLINWAVITNIHMQYWDQNIDNKCTFCKINEETYRHLFLECPYTRDLWSIVDFDKDTVITYKGVILNQLAPRQSVKNFLCLLCKQFIYASRCLQSTPSLHQFRNYVRKIENIERYIAKCNGKLSKHEIKWTSYINILK